jgi:DNA invertase Pin-like site-specific DNA recombinase
VAKLGYCRCSTVGQDTATQQAKLAKLGAAAKNVWVDHGFTGKTMTRAGLENVLKALQPGDELVVPAMDRLARNARETLRVVDELTEAGVTLNVGGTVYEPGSHMSRLFLTILAAVAEAEGGWISARTKEALARPEVRAKLKGKKTRMSPKNDETIAWQHEHGMTVAELAERFNTSRPSIYRAIGRHAARQPRREPGQGSA